MLHLFAPSGVSKASNARMPLIGPAIRSCENIYVPEGGGRVGPPLGRDGTASHAKTLPHSSRNGVFVFFCSRGRSPYIFLCFPYACV